MHDDATTKSRWRDDGNNGAMMETRWLDDENAMMTAMVQWREHDDVMAETEFKNLRLSKQNPVAMMKKYSAVRQNRKPSSLSLFIIKSIRTVLRLK